MWTLVAMAIVVSILACGLAFNVRPIAHRPARSCEIRSMPEHYDVFLSYARAEPRGDSNSTAAGLSPLWGSKSCLPP